MYFPDLSEYVYGATPAQPHILNVGWLSRDHPYTRGTPSESWSNRLALLIQSPVNLYRGKHQCEFCSELSTALAEGNGEIRVRSSDGTVYVAPVLIHHYVVVHGYLPPQAFIDAVDAEVD